MALAQPGQLRARGGAGGPGAPGAQSLSELNMQATRLKFELDALLHPTLVHDKAHKKVDDAFQETADKLAELTRLLERMEQLVACEKDPAARATAGKRLQQDRQRLSEFSSKFESKKMRQNRSAYQQELRSNLFGDRDGAEVLNMFAGYHEERKSLENASSIAAQTIAQGQEIMSELRMQGSTLKGAADKLKEIANVLGLSNSLIKVIERREWGDAMIVYGGMAVTTLLLVLVYFLVAS